MILDEIDKIGSDFRGDPSSALLEVLDPEQNNTFYDNYLELEYDLSKVLFIATANDINAIPPALRDRLEIIDLERVCSRRESRDRADVIWCPSKRKHMDWTAMNFKIGDKVLDKIIQDYTRESGVRELDRQLASIMRYEAKEFAMKGKLKRFITTSLISKRSWESRDTAMTYIKWPICPGWPSVLPGPMWAAISFL